jgi:polyisoprenoid-binding protein YceI
MRPTLPIVALLTLLVDTGSSALSSPPRQSSWTADPQRSEVRFTVTKLGFSDVTGHFRDFAATVHFDAENVGNSRVEWRTTVASVVTGEPNRDSALQGADYFDAARHPALTFTSQHVRRTSDNALEVTGTISIRGIRRPLTFVARPIHVGGAQGFEAEFTLDRYDFNVRGGTVMGRLIGRTVRVYLRLVLGPGGGPDVVGKPASV